jgi:hypothetical protein
VYADPRPARVDPDGERAKRFAHATTMTWRALPPSHLAQAGRISAVTIISVPATAYSENWEYVQFFVGASLAKWAVAVLFIPAFYRHDVTTIYEFLGHRFGQRSQVTASVLFFWLAQRIRG